MRTCLLSVLLIALPALLWPPLLAATGMSVALPAPMLASPWPQPAPDPGAYLFSEKLDGVRARWDGQRLSTRNGNPIAVPPGFTAGWPVQPLDGELWIGRGQFELTSTLVRARNPADPRWRQVHLHVFDLPAHAGDFAQRHAALQTLLARPAPHLRLVQQHRLADHAALQRWLQQVLTDGGEGLIAHHRHARYVPGRSALLYKIKPWHDAEANVIAHLPGRGRHAGHIGALQVRDAQGRVFAVGSGLSDAQRRGPPAIGSRITYRYTERTSRGLPRFPRFVRVRDDEPPASGQ